MPYNNTPIAPAKEITGHVSLPLARVQKIITADPNHLTVSKNASFAIALATEMFIQHLATTTHNVVKAERKPRRNIQYRDVSSAVSKTDNLEFLVDVVPKTSTWGAVKRGGEAARKRTADGGSKAGKKSAEEAENGENGQEDGDENADVLQSRENPTLEQRINSQTSAAATTTATPAATNGHKPPTDAMDIDTHTQPHQHQNQPEAQEERQQIQDSDPDDDPAAMQIEMEMRGPPQTQSPDIRTTSGFTAINGSR